MKSKLELEEVGGSWWSLEGGNEKDGSVLKPKAADGGRMILERVL